MFPLVHKIDFKTYCLDYDPLCSEIPGKKKLVNKFIINKLLVNKFLHFYQFLIIMVQQKNKKGDKGRKMGNPNYSNDLTFDEKVMMSIVRAAENFKRAHSNIFKRYELSFPQYNILRVLESSKDGQNKISVVSKIMLTPGANMTGLAKRLEQNGFLVRKPDPADERVTLLAIEEKGRKILKQIEDEKNKSIDRILEGLSKETKENYLAVTKQIIKATTRLQKEMAG